ncbi:thioredoxin family protein [Foetidibacter luteolus]|uniref:thioredoxin family protein n=1 Tax=Foetidibacter luteolus TaxID=2608880 RepID=UPI00129B8A89|nr:thioredoxin family protein [Foetidibacter luteolus]
MKLTGEKNKAVIKIIDTAYADKGLDYSAYRQLIDDLLELGKSTSPVQSPALTEYTKLNVARMNRLDKTTTLLPEFQETIAKIDNKQIWLVLTEGWCGDAAQTVPVFAKIAAQNSNIELKFLLREENPELMDLYLYKGMSKSIPKLIVLNGEGEELFNWGPRPQKVQQLFDVLKMQQAPYDIIKEKIHGWYAKDKTISVQQELLALMTEAQ